MPMIAQERERIRRAIYVRCGITFRAVRGHPAVCRLNLGHIGPCSVLEETVPITLSRLLKILNHQ